jgi:hypothetical protein
MRALLLGIILSLSPGFATEITTGFLLGPRYDHRAFYMRGRSGESWQKTYTGSEYRRQAQGKLMNLRLAQGLYQDEWLDAKAFSADANTDSLIAALDCYRSHGVLMISVSLQGGQPGRDGEIYGLGRYNGFKYGPGKGVHVSAFRPDGSLKPEWMSRLERLLRAADQRGMIVNLIYFYQGQDELFDSLEAIQAAALGATDWLINKQFRNVMIEIANEWDLPGHRWDMGNYIPDNILQLITDVRDRFQKRRVDYALPISVSSDGRMNYAASLAQTVDVVLLHGNGRTAGEKVERAAGLRSMERPVLMNEDDNGRETTLENLSRERASCNALFDGAAGWGYMPWVQAQRFPFHFMPAESAGVRDDMPAPERDLAYFHAVLDHIASLTLRKAPHSGHAKK